MFVSERWRVRGIRGATTVAKNEEQEIIDASYELVNEMIERNDVEIDDIASVIFTVTQDLNAVFPAVGGRRAGLGQVPLLCATEIPVPGGQARCVRVLMHVNTTKSQSEIQHVYLGDAVALRPDLDHSEKPKPIQAAEAGRIEN